MRLKFISTLIILFLLPFSPRTPVFAQESLSETFISSDGTLRFNHPYDWISDEEAGIAYMLRLQTPVMGDTNEIVSYIDLSTLVIFVPEFLAYIGVEPSTAPADALQQAIGATDSGVKIDGQIEAVTLGEIPAARVAFSNEGDIGNYYVLSVGKSLFFAGAVNPNYKAIHEQILATLQFNPLDPAALSFTSTDGSFSFQYPPSYQAPSENMRLYESSTDAQNYGAEILNDGAATFSFYPPAAWVNSVGLPLNTELSKLALGLANLHLNYRAVFFSETPTRYNLEYLTLGNQPAVWVDYATEDGIEGFALAFKVNDIPIGFLAATSLGNLDTLEAELLAIAASATYDPTLTHISGNLQGELPLDTELSATNTGFDPDLWTIELQAGELLQVQLLGDLTHSLQLFAPQAIPALPNMSCNCYSALTIHAEQSGTYTLALNPFTEENLSYTLLATKPTASAVLSFEGEISATTSESNPAFFTFEIDNARPVTISTTGDPLPFLTVQGPNLSSIPTNYPLPDATSFTYPVMLPYSGTYLIAAYGDGDFSISLDSLQPIPVEIGTSVSTEVAQGQNVFYIFDPSAGSTLAIDAVSATLAFEIRLFNSTNGEILVANNYGEEAHLVEIFPLYGPYLIGIYSIYETQGQLNLSITPQ